MSTHMTRHRLVAGLARLLTANARRLAALALASVTLTIGCESPTAPVPGARVTGRVAVFMNAGTTGVSGIVIRVSGPGIVKGDGTTPDTLVFNLPMTGGVASGALDIPAGPSRVIDVSAYQDATESHRGSVTTDISSGTNPTLTITLYPITGSVPVTLTIGSLLVMVQPDSVYVGLGDTLRLTASVRDHNNSGVAAKVIWGSSNAARATVDTSGLLTMRDTGVVYVVATQGGVSGIARIYGKRFPQTTTSYQLTWNGSRNRNWSDAGNWTAQEGVAARVPTAADSVVIPSGIVNQPMVNDCAAGATVRDLVMEPSATLTTSCAATTQLRVYGRATGVNVGVTVRAEHGARLSGTFAMLRVEADSVALAGLSSATSVELVKNGRLTVGGNRLDVAGTFTIADSARLVMAAAGDTLSVRGAMSVGDITRSSVQAGVLRLGGNFTATGLGWQPGGTLQMVFDGTTTQSVSTGSGQATWPRIRIANSSAVHFNTYNADTLQLPGFRVDSAKVHLYFYAGSGTGTIRLTPEGDTLRLGTGGLGIGNPTLIVDGSVTLPAKPAGATATPTISGTALRVLDGTLTVGTDALVNVSNLHLEGSTLAGTVAAAMTTLRRTQQTVVPGVAAFAGNVTLQDSSRLVVGPGTSVIGGGLLLADSSGLVMTDAADTLSVRGAVTVGDNSRNQAQAGVLRVGGNFTATGLGWQPAGTLEMIFDGTTTQSVSSGSGQATWSRIRIANSSAVHFNTYNADTLQLPGFRMDSPTAHLYFYAASGTGTIKLTPEGDTLHLGTGGLGIGNPTLIVDGSVTLPAKPAGATATPTISGTALRVLDGTLVVGADAVVNVSQLHLEGSTLQGTVAAGMTTLRRTEQAVTRGVAAFAGNVTLQDTSRLVVGAGTSVIGGTLTLADSSGLAMTDAADTLSVRGAMTVGDLTRSSVQAGVLRLGGNFTATGLGWQPAGTLEMIFDGTTTQSVSSGSGMATWPRIRIANSSAVHFNTYNADTLQLPGFRVDSAKVHLYFYAGSGTGTIKVTPEADTLRLGTGGLGIGNPTLIVDGSVMLPAKPAGATATPTISGTRLHVRKGLLSIGSASLVNASAVILDSATISGVIAASTTTFRNTHQVVAPGVATFNGNVVVEDTSRLLVGSGTSVIGGGLSINEWAGLEMLEAADTLSVRGAAVVSDNSRNSVQAGVLRLGGNFTATGRGWQPSGTLEMIFDGTTTQSVSTGSDSASWPRIRVKNPTAVHFNTYFADTLRLPDFRMDAPSGHLYFYAGSGTGAIKLTPEGGTLTLGTGGLSVGNPNLIVNGHVTLPAKPAGSTSTPAVGGNRITILGSLTTGAGTNLTGYIALHGAINFGGTFNALHLELAGDEQIVPPSLQYGALTVSGHARFLAGDTVMFNSSGNITSSGVIDVDTTAYVQFGRLSGVGFSMVAGAQLNNRGVVRYTSGGTWTTPVGASVIGNMPASTAPAHILVLTHPEATGTADSAVVTMPVVKVIDALSYPLKGVTVTFSPIVGGSQLTGVTVVTDTNGVARLGTWKLGPTETNNVIEATVPGATRATMQVSASYTRRLQVGSASACATSNAGATYCWGDARLWQFGSAASAFGSGTDTAFKTPMATALGPFARVSLGNGEHLCAIDGTDAASCWGKGGSGQLGGGTNGDATGNAPVTVSGGIAWKEISRGPTTTCGVSTTNVGYCWGSNANGMLGSGNADYTAIVNTPTAISGSIAFKSIAVGPTHACGISTGGATYCWGAGSSGQLGDNAATAVSNVPKGQTYPNGVTTMGAAVQVAVGNAHSCVVNSANKVWCWGANGSGQVGDGSQANRYYPREVSPGGLYFTQVTAGNGFTCALADDGKPYCWGVNTVGQLGDGTFFLRTLPTVVGGSAKFNAIASGDSFTCGNKGGTVFCWGAASLGQIGNNSTLNANFPMRVSSPF